MDVTAYKAGVDTDITTKTAPSSISPTNVGTKLKDLADLTKTNVEAAAVSYQAILDNSTTPYPDGSTPGYIQQSTGNFFASAGWVCTNSVICKAGDVINYTGIADAAAVCAIMGYKADGSFQILLAQSVDGTVKNILVPSGIVAWRASSRQASTHLFTMTAGTLKPGYIQGSTILNPIASLTDTAYPPVSLGGYISAITGQFVASASGWQCTDYLPCAEGDVIKHFGLTPSPNVGAAILFKADKTTFLVLIPANTGGTLTAAVPAATDPWVYVRMSATTVSVPVFTISRYVVRPTSLPSAIAYLEKFPAFKLVTFGDSITQYPDTDVTITNGGWIKFVMDSFGFGTRVNYGVGGTGIAQLYASMLAGNAGAGQDVGDVNTILIGTNDWTTSTTLGDFTIDYLGNSGAVNYAATFRKVVDYIKSKKPGCFVTLMTPMYRGAVASTTKVESLPTNLVNGKSLQNFADMVRSIALYEGFGIVDLISRGPITHGNCDLRSGAYQVCQDGVHPTNRGYDGMSKLIIPIMRATIFK